MGIEDLVAPAVTTFDASASSCPATPCSYAWQDLGADNNSAAPNWALGSGKVLLFPFSGAGTKYVELRVTDSQGRVATTKRTVVVASS